MRTALVASIVVLIGTPLAAHGQARVAGYETYAVVAPATGEADAMPLAEQHCATYGRFAHFRRMDGAKAIFDCTPEKIERTRGILPPRGLY